jgi:tRNA(adenine34) deaminase
MKTYLNSPHPNPPSQAGEGTNDHFMRYALNLAKTAQEQGEVPVGAIIVLDGEIIAEGFNQPITSSDPCAHAEIIALRAAGKKLNNYRLPNTTLYVTLEPCAMCAMAIVHARVERLVYATDDPKTGAVASHFQLLDYLQLNHKVQWERGVLAQESSQLLKEFFKARRS